MLDSPAKNSAVSGISNWRYTLDEPEDAMDTLQAIKHVQELVANADKLPERQRRIVLDGVAELCRKGREPLAETAAVDQQPDSAVR